ncbi:MAG TPA: DNA polymerase III subunit gamma/tau [Bacilli bacterium]|nr:DNA polymerase III subunit gamma/tau [Bacilli bacterium]
MAYKALYRTYRPSTFSEVAGQNHIKKTLQNALKANKISHAYLFSGPRGIGKTTIARLLAKAVNCASAPTKEPCNQCASCLSIMYNQSTDIIELDAASNNGVEEIRQILEKVNYLPSNSKFKVYIIDEVHMLSTSAFNALLKTLEEPPAHVIFILATTEAHKIPMTIISRCQRFDFKALSSQEIKIKLQEVTKREAIKVKEDALDAIAETAEGGMRDALSILDQSISYSDDVISIDDVNSVTGRISNYKLIDLVNSFEGTNVAEAIKIVDEILELGKEVNRLVSGLLQFCRDILLYQNTTGQTVFKYIFDNPEFKKLASKIDKKRVYFYIDVIMDIQNKLKYSNNPRIYLEVGVMKIINMTDDDLDIQHKIHQIEERLLNMKGVSHHVENGTVDNSKIEMIDAKVNKLISEITKLELPKLKQKIDANEMISQQGGHDYSVELDEIKKQLANLKYNEPVIDYSIEIENIRTELNQLKNSGQELFTLDEEEKPVFDLENSTIKFDDLYLKVNQLEEDKITLEKQLKHQHEKVQKEIKELKQVIDSIDLTQVADKTSKIDQTSIDAPDLFSLEKEVNLDLVYDKIEHIENDHTKMLNLMTELSESMTQSDENLKLSIEKVNLSIDENEKMIAELNLKWTTENNDLLNLIEELKQTIKEMLVSINAKFDQVDEKQVFVDKIDIKLAQLSEFVKKLGSKLSEVEGKLQIVEHENLSTLSMFENISKQDKQEAQKIPIEIQPEKTAPIKEVPTTVISPKTEKQVREEKPIIIGKSGASEPHKEKEVIKAEPPVVEKEIKDPYDVSYIEQILHDSRSDEAKSERSRIISEWRNLDKGISVSLENIARLLMNATVSAIGINSIIITYPSISMCNHVMSKKMKDEANLIFKTKLGKPLSYIALPNDIWVEKRSEYVGQYNMGVKFPKLKPIDNPDLRVADEIESPLTTEKNKTVEKARSLFGEGLIKIEE